MARGPEQPPRKPEPVGGDAIEKALKGAMAAETAAHETRRQERIKQARARRVVETDDRDLRVNGPKREHALAMRTLAEEEAAAHDAQERSEKLPGAISKLKTERNVRKVAERLTEVSHRVKTRETKAKLEVVLPKAKEKLAQVKEARTKRQDALIEKKMEVLKSTRRHKGTVASTAEAETSSVDESVIEPQKQPQTVLSQQEVDTTSVTEAVAPVVEAPSQSDAPESSAEKPVASEPIAERDSLYTATSPVSQLKEDLQALAQKHAIDEKNPNSRKEYKDALNALLERYGPDNDLQGVWTSHIDTPEPEPAVAAPVAERLPEDPTPFAARNTILADITDGKRRRMPSGRKAKTPEVAPPVPTAAAGARTFEPVAMQPQRRRNNKKAWWFLGGGITLAGVGAALLTWLSPHGQRTEQTARPSATPPSATAPRTPERTQHATSAPSQPGVEAGVRNERVTPMAVTIQNGEGADRAFERLKLSLRAAYSDSQHAPNRLIAHIMEQHPHVLSQAFHFAKGESSAVLQPGDRIMLTADGKLVFEPTASHNRQRVELLRLAPRNANGFEAGEVYRGPMSTPHIEKPQAYKVRSTTVTHSVQRAPRTRATTAQSPRTEAPVAQTAVPENVPPSQPQAPAGDDFTPLSGRGG